jgi:hypothetical protein
MPSKEGLFVLSMCHICSEDINMGVLGQIISRSDLFSLVSESLAGIRFGEEPWSEKNQPCMSPMNNLTGQEHEQACC